MISLLILFFSVGNCRTCCFGFLYFMKLVKTLCQKAVRMVDAVIDGATFRGAELPSAFCAVWQVAASSENQIHGPKYRSRNFILGACF